MALTLRTASIIENVLDSGLKSPSLNKLRACATATTLTPEVRDSSLDERNRKLIAILGTCFVFNKSQVVGSEFALHDHDECISAHS